ncbi:MAG: hypothetical protein OEV77_08910, partial [Nitrospira sp.]|nr:hypothetical protein [Nitrospira sp.]
MVQLEHIERLIKGEHWNPRELLGPHRTSADGAKALVIRSFAPDATEARIIPDYPGGKPVMMDRVHESGLFEATLDAPKGTLKYRIQLTNSEG